MIEKVYLECDHCGEEAIEGDDKGLFLDGSGTECMTCGFPGSVVCEESSDDDSEIGSAYWLCSDGNDDVCDREDCEDCAPTRKRIEDAYEQVQAELQATLKHRHALTIGRLLYAIGITHPAIGVEGMRAIAEDINQGLMVALTSAEALGDDGDPRHEAWVELLWLTDHIRTDPCAPCMRKHLDRACVLLTEARSLRAGDDEDTAMAAELHTWAMGLQPAPPTDEQCWPTAFVITARPERPDPDAPLSVMAIDGIRHRIRDRLGFGVQRHAATRDETLAEIRAGIDRVNELAGSLRGDMSHASR